MRESGLQTDLLFATFDNKYDTIHNGVSLNTPGLVPPILQSDIEPRGTTALHDGIGKVLTDTVKFVNEQEQIPGKVTVFIMTDGAENASTEWSSEQVKRMIGELKELGWQFIFAGANQDAVLTSQAYGMESAESISFAADGAHAENMMAAASESIRRYQKTKAGASRAEILEEVAFSSSERRNSEL